MSYARVCLRADWARNSDSWSRVTLAIWRLGQAAHDQPGLPAFLTRRLHAVLDGIWTRGVVGAELPRTVPAGPGVCLPHAGRGVILNPRVVLGSHVKIYHQVTIGSSDGHVPPGRSHCPVIGDGVLLGVGAKVIGSVLVGDGARVAANAVVVRDVPAGATVAGIPAQVVRSRLDRAPGPQA